MFLNSSGAAAKEQFLTDEAEKAPKKVLEFLLRQRAKWVDGGGNEKHPGLFPCRPRRARIKCMRRGEEGMPSMFLFCVCIGYYDVFDVMQVGEICAAN